MVTNPVEIIDVLRLPKGWVLLGIDPIVLSVVEVDDTPAIRYRLNVRGHDVQIIHDGNDDAVTVFVGERHMDILPKAEIGAFIRTYAV